MKKFITTIIILLAAVAANAQPFFHDNIVEFPKKPSVPIVIPGPGHIDVEQLNRHIDTKMDISHLTLSELRVLRNAFFARQGYAFLNAELRAIFNATTWYDKLCWEKYFQMETGDPEHPYDGPIDTVDWRNDYQLMFNHKTPVRLSRDEQAFIKRLKAREDELRKQNFKAPAGMRVNIDNLINPFQLNDMPADLRDKLARNGFAIVPADNRQMFHVYERNDYHVFPNFVTTDSYLQLFHLYFDCLLREIEQKALYAATSDFCTIMRKALASEAAAADDVNARDASAYGEAYFAVAQALLDGSDDVAELISGNNIYATQITDEMERIKAAEDNFSDFIGSNKIKFPYSLFRPRGHYTRNDTLGRYFRAMMWLQSVPFGTDRPEQMTRAVTMADVMCRNTEAMAAYRRVTEPIGFLMGNPDNVTITQLYEETLKTGKTTAKLLKSKKDMKRLCAAVEAVGERQTRIRPRFERTSHCKINFMPQRYMPDAEVLQETVDYVNEPSRRPAPRGLDVIAAMGWSAAERILIDEMGENSRWDGYSPALDSMKRRMNDIDWSETVATRWMESLTTLADTASGMPYFMLTPEWQKKGINAALASWTELKHDAILYAKQPFAAECGGAGPPDPVTKGYVEPNIRYWKKAIALLDATKAVLDRNGLTTEKADEITGKMREEAEFLLHISEKELAGKRITDEEYDQLRVTGSRFEYISLQLLREPDQYFDSWDDVQGTDKSIALVADVYTANGDNVRPEDRGVLYGAVGPADEIYVVVEIDGYLYLTRGAVFSYREFVRPLGTPRMTDEEWQNTLKTSPDTGRQEWMKDITVPATAHPEDNERAFYSSGC